MKKRNIYLPLAAMILTAAIAIPVAAQNLVPFKGALQGTDKDGAFNFPIVQVFTNGTGTGTHLGEFSYAEENTVNVVTGIGGGSIHWVAANGDSIDSKFTGTGGLTDAPPLCPGLGERIIRITEIHTITGGTGRFAGAQGSFTVERLANAATFVTSGSFHGAITSPGAGH